MATAPTDARPGRQLAPVAGLVAASAAGLTGLVTVTLVDPNVAGHYPTCPFLALTGWYCPGCGSLRALHALAHGHPLAALGFNPLLVAMLPVVAGLYLGWARRVLTGEHRRWAAPGWLIWALLALTVAFWVLRNLPVGAWLAP